MNLNKIREDLKGLKDIKGLGKKLEVVAFGSQVKGGERPTSDLDIAIITRIHDKEKNLQIWKSTLPYNYDPYDIKIFELLPLRIKMSIIKDYEVIYGDKLEISEYFYHYRKLWMDSKHRILRQF
jgi:predicted nucleotidyltransferase